MDLMENRAFYTLKEIEQKYGIKDATIRSYLSRGEVIPKSVVGKVGTTTIIDKQFVDVFYGDLNAIRYKYEDSIREKLSPAPKNLAEWFFLLGVFSVAVDRKILPKQAMTLGSSSAQKWLNGEHVNPNELSVEFAKSVWMKYRMPVDTYLSELLGQWIRYVAENPSEKVEVDAYFGSYLAGWGIASKLLKNLED